VKKRFLHLCISVLFAVTDVLRASRREKKFIELFMTNWRAGEPHTPVEIFACYDLDRAEVVFYTSDCVDNGNCFFLASAVSRTSFSNVSKLWTQRKISRWHVERPECCQLTANSHRPMRMSARLVKR